MIDPIDGNLFDLPDYEHIQDETFRPLPPPDSPGADVSGESETNKPSQTKDSSGNIRRVVKRPKLDADRLVSERGLPALRSTFDNVKFKGKGNEEADLKMLLRHMEHWAHRLFPQLQFEEFVERVERLGNKNIVQACLKQIRLDLPIFHEDFTNNEVESGRNSGVHADPEELDLFSGIQNASEECSPPLSTSITEEQQQRIERNRQKALERLQAKRQLNSQSQENAEQAVIHPNEERSTIVDQEPNDLPKLELGNVPAQATAKRQNESIEDDD